MESKTKNVSPAGRKNRLSIEKSQRANLKEKQPKSRRPYHSNPNKENVGPTTTSDKIKKVNFTSDDAMSFSSLHHTDSIQHICQRVENLTRYIENDIRFLKKVHDSLKKKREEKISKIKIKSQDKMTWAEYFRANTSSSQATNTHYGPHSGKPQYRTVEVRSSSKDAFLRPATRELKQKDLTPIETQPKRLPTKELPPKIHQHKDHITSQDKMTWAERFKANSFSSQATNSQHGPYPDIAFEKKCRTVEVRSSSEDSFPKPGKRDLNQKAPTPIRTPPKRFLSKERPLKIFPTEKLPEEELLPKHLVNRNPPLEKSTQTELPASPHPEYLIIKKHLPKADLMLQEPLPEKPLAREDRPPEELVRRVSGGNACCTCNCKKNYYRTESRSQQTSFGMEVPERKKAETCDKETEVTLRDAFFSKARAKNETTEFDEHMFKDYMELYYLEEKISRKYGKPNLQSDRAVNKGTKDLPPRSYMSKYSSCPVGKRGHKSTDKNRIDIGGTRNDDPVKGPSYLLTRRQAGGTNTETHNRKGRLLQKYALPVLERITEVYSEVSDGQSPSRKTTPEAIVVNSHSQPKDTESHKIREDTFCRRQSSAEESNRPYDDRRVHLKPNKYQLKNDSGSGINNNDIQPRSLYHEDDGSTRCIGEYLEEVTVDSHSQPKRPGSRKISGDKFSRRHSSAEESDNRYQLMKCNGSGIQNNEIALRIPQSSSESDWEERSLNSFLHDSGTSQSSFTTAQTCYESSFDDWEAFDTSSEDERPIHYICPCMYEIYRELEAFCLNINTFRNYL